MVKKQVDEKNKTGLIFKIIKLSASQNATCMYTQKELKRFSSAKLRVIAVGIAELANCDFEDVEEGGYDGSNNLP